MLKIKNGVLDQYGKV